LWREKKYIIELGQKNKFGVDTTESSDIFTAENLKQYAAVFFLCTTGNVLNDEQQKEFEKFIRKWRRLLWLTFCS
jgi:hypothetical protein